MGALRLLFYNELYTMCSVRFVVVIQQQKI